MLYIIVNTRTKNRGIKVSPRSGGQIGENFLLAKISGNAVSYGFHLVE